MKDFFFIEDEPEVQPEVEPKVEPTYSWCFPVVNGVRTKESQELINKGI